MPLRGREREAITSADKLLRKGGCSWRKGGGRDLISGGRFLMQGDPRGIKTAGLITGDAAREVFIFTAVKSTG